MKLKHCISARIAAAAVLGGALLTAKCAAQSGGQFDLSWFTIDGGGGKSSAGKFEVSGTLG